MHTLVSDWYIVDIIDNDTSIGKVLWCICVEDLSLRFAPGQYICTSKIESISPSNKTVTTFSKSLYKLAGHGNKADIQVEHFDLLRNGYNPKEIKEMLST